MVQINMWLAGKTVWFLINTWHTWAPWRWWSAVEIYNYFCLLEIVVVQESSSSDEANVDSASRQAVASRPPSAAGSQTLPRPGSAYGSLPPAPSPAGSVGSRSNTPASLSGQFQMRTVLWRCWLGGRKGTQAVKSWVMGCWLAHLSGARCRVAYGPADATATHCLLLQ